MMIPPNRRHLHRLHDLATGYPAHGGSPESKGTCISQRLRANPAAGRPLVEIGADISPSEIQVVVWVARASPGGGQP